VPIKPRGTIALVDNVFGHDLPRNRVVAALSLIFAAGRTDTEHAIGAMGSHTTPSQRHFASHSAG
jgi:hypothetical protein